MRGVVWLLLASVLCEAAEIDVKAIAGKFEKVGEWQLPPAPDYPIYDPFRRAEPLMKRRSPPPVRKSRAPTLKVEAILNDKAYVDGRWVGAGDRLGDYRVTAVGREGLFLQKGGRTFFVAMKRKKGLLKIKDKER